MKLVHFWWNFVTFCEWARTSFHSGWWFQGLLMGISVITVHNLGCFSQRVHYRLIRATRKYVNYVFTLYDIKWKHIGFVDWNWKNCHHTMANLKLLWFLLFFNKNFWMVSVHFASDDWGEENHASGSWFLRNTKYIYSKLRNICSKLRNNHENSSILRKNNQKNYEKKTF